MAQNKDNKEKLRIHPDDLRNKRSIESRKCRTDEAVTLTVWKRSSLSFHGTDGFTVFDTSGRLAFRVDNYSRNTKRYVGLVLMDGDGNPLLTLKPQILSMQHQWNAYKGGDGCKTNPPKSKLFSMRTPSFIFNTSKEEAIVFMEGSQSQTPDFKVEGSFRERDCRIRTSNGQVAAKIIRKKVMNTTVLLSDDVFSLVIQPGFEPQIIMAFIVILDRICKKLFVPVLCNSEKL